MSDGDSLVLAGDNARVESLVMRRADADAVRSQARTKQWVNRIKALVETKRKQSTGRRQDVPETDHRADRAGVVCDAVCLMCAMGWVRCPRSRGR